jgi:hypothetical protein
MATEVQICNLALSWMGQNLINSLGDNQNEAKVMKANYALSRDKVIGDHAWSFALSRVTLAPIATAPAFGSGNQFLIPSNVLRVHRVYRANNAVQTGKFQNARWVREGQNIIATEEVVWAHFIVRVTNSDLFNAQVAHAIAAQLGVDTALTFTESLKMVETMEKRYTDKLADAIYADGSQGRTEVIESTRLTGVRKR